MEGRDGRVVCRGRRRVARRPAGAGLLLTSGLDGMEAGVSCHLQNRAREARAREEAAIAQDVAAREQAWKLTQEAEAAPRAGDCVTVLQLDREISGAIS